MNLILFDAGEIERPLSRDDRRARHILDVLRRQPGESFDAGLINGPRGKATVLAVDARSMTLRFEWGAAPEPLPVMVLIIGLPRPQTARDLLRDATTLGATSLEFVRTEKGDANYALSTLWQTGEWRERLLAGAAQAFDTHIPQVRHGHALLEALATIPAGASRFALDNYESSVALGRCDIRAGQPVVLAIGPERGWATRERASFREHGFTLVHLGARVLRTETAATAALALIRAKQGSM